MCSRSGPRCMPATSAACTARCGRCAFSHAPPAPTCTSSPSSRGCALGSRRLHSSSTPCVLLSFPADPRAPASRPRLACLTHPTPTLRPLRRRAPGAPHERHHRGPQDVPPRHAQRHGAPPDRARDLAAHPAGAPLHHSAVRGVEGPGLHIPRAGVGARGVCVCEGALLRGALSPAAREGRGKGGRGS